MYPDWPESEADLVPLPQVDGPKLPPFNFQGPQAIKFIEHMGEGLHSHVFKVEILGQLYALKLVKKHLDSPISVPNDCDWEGLPEPDTKEFEELGEGKEYRELYSALYNYAEPFTCECRAYGRIQESGHETLALKCYGYVLLDEEHERRMIAQFQHDSSGVCLDFNGSIDASIPDDVRLRFVGKSGRPPPIRGIVKELGVPDEENLRPAVARSILRDIIRMQKLGIIGIDVMDVQIVSGKLCDFSTAITTPHFLTTPEINPHLTAEMVSMMEFATFDKALSDYKRFDDMIREWNRFGGKAHPISITAFPGGRGCGLQYNLRNKAARERIFTYVDPRLAKPASPTAYRVATMAAPGDRNSTSLRAILTQAKPQISCMKYTASKNTIGRWPLPKHHGIAEWSEFNLESLVESYGHILNREGPGGILAPDLPNNKIEISQVNHIRLLIEWNSRVIDMAQKFIKESLGIDTGVSLLNDVTTRDGSARARIRTAPAKGAPAVDHVIALDDHPLTNLVVGLVKSHSRFPASVVVDNSHLTTTDQMWALGQLANLCHTAKTRYGYIMTYHALVACRYTIFEDPTYPFGRFKVALMPVPWSKRGPEQLTTDLALWWLCMLAASAPHNRSTLEHEMVPINKWEVKYYDDGRGWVRRHKYSGYEEPTEAPSPPPYETPAPDDVAGNAALFMTAVGGLNVQGDFDPNPPPIPGQPADLAQSYQDNPTDVVVAYDGQGLSFDVANEGQDYFFYFDAANEGEDFDFNI